MACEYFYDYLNFLCRTEYEFNVKRFQSYNFLTILKVLLFHKSAVFAF